MEIFLEQLAKTKNKASLGGCTLGQGHKDVALVKAPSTYISSQPQIKNTQRNTPPWEKVETANRIRP